jgi:hypothetical protein
MTSEAAEEFLRDGLQLVRLRVYILPGAHQTAVVGRHPKGLKIKVAAAPQDGAANEELIAFLSDILNIAKRRLTLRSGLRSREKMVEIEGVRLAEVWASLGVLAPPTGD